MSESELPHTLNRSSNEAASTGVQVEPCQRSRVRPLPAANTSVWPAPHTPNSATAVPLVMALHAAPSKWKMVPLPPTVKDRPASGHREHVAGRAAPQPLQVGVDADRDRRPRRARSVQNRPRVADRERVVRGAAPYTQQIGAGAARLSAPRGAVPDQD